MIRSVQGDHDFQIICHIHQHHRHHLEREEKNHSDPFFSYLWNSVYQYGDCQFDKVLVLSFILKENNRARFQFC